MNDDEIVHSVLHDFKNTPPSLKGIEEPKEKNLFQYSLYGITNTSQFFTETTGCNCGRVNDDTQVVQLRSKIKESACTKVLTKFFPKK